MYESIVGKSLVSFLHGFYITPAFEQMNESIAQNEMPFQERERSSNDGFVTGLSMKERKRQINN